MPEQTVDRTDIGQWDPTFVKQVRDVVAPLVNRWFRAEVRGLDAVPPGGVLVVSNHSGGMFTPDVLLFASAFYERFGYRRALYTLAADIVFIGPFAQWLPRAGVIHASRENAAKALRSGGAVLVFPGGDHDSYRPTSARNTIDFNGRTGYIRTAIESGVPIVPMVSIGGQESQLFLSRGNWLANRLGINRLRFDVLPVSFGFPFGLSVFLPPNLPLPTKIITQVLQPIDVVKQFGDNPDISEVDVHVRSIMQSALDGLASERRFPVLG
jgi:1-acyl-sn-glycerol-3-phosphate acyltransferase